VNISFDLASWYLLLKNQSDIFKESSSKILATSGLSAEM
jgi:hypothetical protein